MGRERGRKLGVQTRPLVLRQLGRAVQARLGGPRQGQDLSPAPNSCVSVWRTSVTNTFPHPPTLAAEAAHHLREVVLEVLRLRLQRRALGGALARLST